MGFLSLIFLAIGLSVDSFAASVCSGLSLCRKHLKIRQALKISLTLAVFQGAMPALGWWLGSAFKGYIERADHWIALALLSVLGIRMIFESRVPLKERKVKNPTSMKAIIPMAIGTSIDALAVGISLSFFVHEILFPSLLIGAVTLIFSLGGIYMGRKAGIRLAGKAEIVGGLILILIGVKIFAEHMFF